MAGVHERCAPSSTKGKTMLTTTVDGLWVLQVLSGIEVLAPELGLRPHLPRVETPAMALAHPIAGDLRAAGAIDAADTVDETVREWLTVLSRRDTALLLHVNSPASDREPDRVLLARFSQWWVGLERHGIQVRLSGIGTATSEQTAGQLINSVLERLCGSMSPAEFRPLTLDVAELLAAVRDREELRAFLLDLRLDGDQIAALTIAADRERSAQASIVAIQSGDPGGPSWSHVERATVTIIDTPQGRMVSEQTVRDGRSWMIVSPGTMGTISSAVVAMMRNLPSNEQWYSYRKVV